MARGVGFVGLGLMGLPMAKNLLKAGFQLQVCNRSQKPVEELAQAGAVRTSSPGEAARGAQVVVVMVADGPQVEDVVLGNEGILEGLQPGATLIIMSSIEPMVVRNLAGPVASRGAKLLDAPVTRGVQAAIDGTLAIMVGGDIDALEGCRDVLQAMGTDIIHCGDIGAGEIVKLANNYMALCNTVIACEAVALAVKAGVKADKVVEVVGAGSGNSYALQHRFKDRILKGDFNTGFYLHLAIKDLGIALNTARQLTVPVPAGAACHEAFQAEAARAGAREDFLEFARSYEKLIGVEMRG